MTSLELEGFRPVEDALSTRRFVASCGPVRHPRWHHTELTIGVKGSSRRAAGEIKRYQRLRHRGSPSPLLEARSRLMAELAVHWLRRGDRRATSPPWQPEKVSGTTGTAGLPCVGGRFLGPPAFAADFRRWASRLSTLSIETTALVASLVTLLALLCLMGPIEIVERYRAQITPSVRANNSADRVAPSTP
jgi:hypothetical protein